MNEFNKSVKQKSKTGFIILLTVIAATLVCLAFSAVVYTDKASAEPTIADYQRALDETAVQYYDALAAQSEAKANVDEAESTIA